MLELVDICKIYRMGDNEVRALDGVSLSIREGEMVAIMGPSGSGKSTIMNIIGCLDQPSSGSYRLAGREVAELNEWDQARLRNQELGFVFQSFNLLSNLTALQNVELPLIYAGVAVAERHVLARQALEKMGLEHRLHHKPRELSGGQQQRVAIARALVNQPRLLLADEPTGNLDRQTGDKIADLLFSLNREHGTTLILVTHDPLLAARCDRRLRLVDGQLREEA